MLPYVTCDLFHDIEMFSNDMFTLKSKGIVGTMLRKKWQLQISLSLPRVTLKVKQNYNGILLENTKRRTKVRRNL